VATELSVPGGNLNRSQSTARALVMVYLDDVNDNAPRFTSTTYTAQLPENATAGVRVINVEAVDPDTESFGRVRYTAILGYKNFSLVLDSQTGVVTVSNDNHGFDREESAGIRTRRYISRTARLFSRRLLLLTTHTHTYTFPKLK